MLKGWVFRYFFTQKLKIHSMLEITFKTFYFYKNLKGAHCLESPMYSNLKVVFKCIDVLLFLGDFYPSISSILGTSCSMERWNFIAYSILIYLARWEEYTLKWYICSIHLLIHFLRNHNWKNIDCDANSVAFKEL